MSRHNSCQDTICPTFSMSPQSAPKIPRGWDICPVKFHQNMQLLQTKIQKPLPCHTAWHLNPHTSGTRADPRSWVLEVAILPTTSNPIQYQHAPLAVRSAMPHNTKTRDDTKSAHLFNKTDYGYNDKLYVHSWRRNDCWGTSSWVEQITIVVYEPVLVQCS